jgi:raffinose/stachyose/melibiose transport system substrate-binding protein
LSFFQNALIINGGISGIKGRKFPQYISKEKNMKRMTLILFTVILAAGFLCPIYAGGSKAPDGKTTITVMYSGTPAPENDFETVVLPRLVEQHFPNVKLEVTKLPDDQYYTVLSTRLSSGQAPDMFLVQPKNAGQNGVFPLAKAGYLAPVDDIKCLSLIGAGVEASRYNGHVYSVPAGVAILGAYYNINLFNQYNLKIPTNWDEFLNVCKVLKNNGIQPIVMGDKDNYVLQFGLYQIAASVIYPSKPTYDDDLYTGKTKFTDPGTWDKVLSLYKTLYDNGYINPQISLGLGNPQSLQQFIDGKAAMIFDGSFNAASIRAQGGANFERGYFPLPGNAAGQPLWASMAPGGGLGIYSKSKNIELCKQILEWWNDGESELYQAMADNGRSIVTYGYGSDRVDPLFAPFMPMYSAGKAAYWCNQAWPAGVNDEMQAQFSAMVSGQNVTVADITKAMQAKFDELTR